MKITKDDPIWIYLGALIILMAPLYLPFLGIRLVDGHDSMAGFIRAMCMERYMGHGQTLVRWAPEVNLGYGYPMFNFYPPFFSFICVLLFKITHQMVLSINLACIFFWILSGAGMFLLAREFWGNEGGLLSAVLYVYAPYHIQDLYIRGAFAEFTSFSFFPFILLSLLKLSRALSVGPFLLGVLSVAGLSLDHNIMNMLFLPAAFLYMFYLYFFENRTPWILMGLAIFGLGLMLSAFFWMPALAEKKYLHLEFLTGLHYDFHENFISFRKLFWPFHVWTMDHISFQMGIIHLLLCLASLFLFTRLQAVSRAGQYLFFLSVGVTAVFLTLPYSSFFWERLALLDYVQFPWRFLTIIAFSASILCGSIMVLIKNPSAKKIVLIIAVLLPMAYLKTVDQPKFFKEVVRVEDFLALGKGEYTPRWVKSPPFRHPEAKFEILKGEGQLEQEKAVNPVHYETTVQLSTASVICFHSFYFPGWQVFIDGHPTTPYLDNPYGAIVFIVPPGGHDLKVIFGTTPAREAAGIVSCAGLILLLLFAFQLMGGSPIWRIQRET